MPRRNRNGIGKTALVPAIAMVAFFILTLEHRVAIRAAEFGSHAGSPRLQTLAPLWLGDNAPSLEAQIPVLSLLSTGNATGDALCITNTDLRASRNHFIIIAATLRNGRKTLPSFLDSLISQQYPNLTLVIYDDSSNDGGPEYLETCSSILPFQTIVLRGDKRQGPAHGKWRLIQFIKHDFQANPMDLVLFLDADDKVRNYRPSRTAYAQAYTYTSIRHGIYRDRLFTMQQFARADVLHEIDSTFRERKPWFAYGRIRGYCEVSSACLQTTFSYGGRLFIVFT